VSLSAGYSLLGGWWGIKLWDEPWMMLGGHGWE
jgi:hypothetical protein